MKHTPPRMPAIGDTLIIAIPAESREWGYNPAPDGTKVKVLGFGRIANGRTNNFGHKPGIYLNRCSLDVKLPGGKTHSISHCHVTWPDGSSVGSGALDDKTADRVSDLPHTVAWEEDIVHVTRADAPFGHYPMLTVEGVEYLGFGTEEITYRVAIPNGGTTYLRESEITLVRRGPVWAYYHRELPSLHLSDAELVNLHRRLGLAREVRNPRTNDYSWTVSELLEDIKAGTVDALNAENGFFGSGVFLTGYRFDDWAVGEIARRLTLEGWKDATPEKLAEYDKPHLERRERVDAMVREIEARA